MAICSGSPATSTGRSGSLGFADLTHAIMASISAIMLSRALSRAGSITIESMPLRMPRSGGVLVVMLVEPTMAPASNSHTSARPEPLCSPNGNTTPRGWVYMTEGSVVGFPA